MASGRFRPTVGAPGPSSEPAGSDPVELAEALGSRVLVDITIPRTNVAGKMRLVTRRERFEAHAEARRALQEGGFPVDQPTALGVSEQWSYEVGVRMIAAAIRDPKNPERALGSVDDWRECDDDQLDALYRRLQDLSESIDPLGPDGAGLTEQEIAAMVTAAKKGDAGLLIEFGSRKLASFILSSAGQPSTSPTPT